MGPGSRFRRSGARQREKSPAARGVSKRIAGERAGRAQTRFRSADWRVAARTALKAQRGTASVRAARSRVTGWRVGPAALVPLGVCALGASLESRVVTVLMSVYNTPTALLDLAIRSVLRQTYSDF